MRDSTAKHLSRLHTMLYRATSGVVGRRLVDNDMLLLTTTGRRTGRPHTVPLLYLDDVRGYIVFASWGGRENHPEWYLNLRDSPNAVVQVRGEHLAVMARTASGKERERWWEQAMAAYDGYQEYQSRTDRQIPVVVLETA
jgi:deazaflavin-dependent oxidoreductase (nitroreductase family)